MLIFTITIIVTWTVAVLYITWAINKDKAGEA